MENQHLVQDMTTFQITFTYDDAEQAQSILDNDFFRADGLLMAHGGVTDFKVHDEEEDEYFTRHKGFFHLTYETHVFNDDEEIEETRLELLKHLWMSLDDFCSKEVEVFTTTRLTVPREAQLLLFGE